MSIPQEGYGVRLWNSFKPKDAKTVQQIRGDISYVYKKDREEMLPNSLGSHA